MSLTLSQISSLRNVMQDDRNRMELKCLLQTKDQYDCLIRDRKALLAEQDSQVRASEQVPGRARYSRAEPWNEFTPVRKKNLIQALEYKAASAQRKQDRDEWIQPGSHSSQQRWLGD